MIAISSHFLYIAMWMDPEDIVLSEITQSQKGIYIVQSYFYVKSKIFKLSQESTVVITRVLGRRNGEILVKRKFQLCMMYKC
jgi:hypothetical protein